MSTQEEVLSFISQRLRIPRERLSLQTRFVEDLGVDSLSSIELLVSVEERFDVVISQEQAADKIRSVADLLAVVQQSSSSLTIQ